MAIEETINLLGYNRVDLQRFFNDIGERSFRANQWMRWCYHQDEKDFDSLTVFPKSLRAYLKRTTSMSTPDIVERFSAQDGTQKWLMRSSCGDLIETVLIPDTGRHTLCISSQVGCALDCSFCATGKQGFNGNLSAAEIVGQVLNVQRDLSKQVKKTAISNIVFMGMGEPLLNFEAVMAASDLFVDDLAFGLSKRRVTISTAGVVPRIYDMCGRTEVALAISLHAPTDELRDQLVPINRRYPLSQLLKACEAYLDSLDAKREVMIEYTLLSGVNDSVQHARQLADLIGDIRCIVNLIPFNSFSSSIYERSPEERLLAFQEQLKLGGTMTLIRRTRGAEVQAACGQLVGKVSDRTNRARRYANEVPSRAVALG